MRKLTRNVCPGLYERSDPDIVQGDQTWLFYVYFIRVSNTPANLLELFFPPGNLQSLLEIFWLSLRVCMFVVNISYTSVQNIPR